MKVTIRSIPEVPVYPEGESKFTSDTLNRRILPLIKSMGLPHTTRQYSVREAADLLTTYIAHGCEAELVE